MKTKLFSITTLALFLLIPAELVARGFSRGGGNRSSGRSASSISRPSARPSRPTPSRTRPSTSTRLPSSHSRPSVSRPSVSRPSVSRPTTSLPSKNMRPSTRPSTPTTRPSVPTTRPSVPTTRPSTPTTRPSVPTTRPSVPTTRPSVPTTRPGGGDNSLGLRPSNPPSARPAIPGGGDRPTTLPAERPGNRPNIGDRPTTLPAERPGNRPNIGDRPTTLPSERPGLGNRPGNGNRPTIPDPPGRPARPDRPDWGDRWQNNDNKFNNIGNQWNSNNTNIVNNFQINRSSEWNNINRRWNERGWHASWGTAGYRSWRGGVWGYRGNRCREVWYRTGPLHYHNHFFNTHWFGSCWWRPRPYVYHNCSPWWWWRPVAWASVGFFFGQALDPEPIVYNPGTTVIYEGDTVYINGESAGDATAYRQETISLANPPVEEIPLPEPPPAPEGTPETEVVDEDPEKPQGDWLPVGVWALTQQEQGDATMFFQLSIDKKGIVGGAYKNVMTGDEQPVVGQLDFESQRVAWHIGEATTTVYETGLSNFENDVAGVFVHFGDTQTQNWLLVRMPSPEMPPGTVKLPEIAAN